MKPSLQVWSRIRKKLSTLIDNICFTLGQNKNSTYGTTATNSCSAFPVQYIADTRGNLHRVSLLGKISYDTANKAFDATWF